LIKAFTNDNIDTLTHGIWQLGLFYSIY